MPRQAVATVRLTDLTGAYPAPWEVQVMSLSVNDRLGLQGDTGSLAFDADGGAGEWAVSGLEDFPRSVRADVALGIEGGEPPVEHGPYYLRRGSGAEMESGVGYSFGLSRASASADMERILRASMVRQFAFVLGGDFSSPSPFTFQELTEQQGYDGLVGGLLDLGLGTALAPLTNANFAQLRSVTLQTDADTWDDSVAAAFLDGWRGVPVPFLFRLADLFTERAPDRASAGYGIDLFNASAALDASDHDLTVSMGDVRRRNNLTENRANARYAIKTGDDLQRTELQQAGRTGADAIGGLPLKPSAAGRDLLPPTLLSGEFPDEEAARLAVYGRAAQQSLEAISASVEIDWHPYLRNGRIVTHRQRRYRVTEISHDLEKLSTGLTMIPVVSGVSQF